MLSELARLFAISRPDAGDSRPGGLGAFSRLHEVSRDALARMTAAGMASSGGDADVRAAFLLVNDLAVLILRDRLREVLGLDPLSLIPSWPRRNAAALTVALLGCRVGVRGPRARRVLAQATDTERSTLATELAQLQSSVRAEKLGEVAVEFDAVHSIQRAVDVGSVDAISQPNQLRPEIIAAIERSLDKHD